MNSTENIEYVVYCRKSSTSDDKQAESIPRQIDLCMKYAKDKGLTVMKKNHLFKTFETESEILKQVKDTESNQKIYNKYNDYFIIKKRIADINSEKEKNEIS